MPSIHEVSESNVSISVGPGSISSDGGRFHGHRETILSPTDAYTPVIRGGAQQHLHGDGEPAESFPLPKASSFSHDHDDKVEQNVG